MTSNIIENKAIHNIHKTKKLYWTIGFQHST
uniref:Uncharacterized protein n=1 Tax=Rhizophora mucronata TaxID=61149 RepID=A0A2P2QJ60_RHIMU